MSTRNWSSLLIFGVLGLFAIALLVGAGWLFAAGIDAALSALSGLAMVLS